MSDLNGGSQVIGTCTTEGQTLTLGQEGASLRRDGCESQWRTPCEPDRNPHVFDVHQRIPNSNSWLDAYLWEDEKQYVSIFVRWILVPFDIGAQTDPGVVKHSICSPPALTWMWVALMLAFLYGVLGKTQFSHFRSFPLPKGHQLFVGARSVEPVPSQGR